jgi:hypothetical protein
MLAALGAVLALIAIGFAAGFAVSRWLPAERPPEARDPRRREPEAQARRLAEELGLDSGQTAKLVPILDRRWRASAEILRRVDPELEQVRARANDEIRALLSTEAQRSRFDRSLAEHAERREAMRRRLELPPGSGPADKPAGAPTNP